MSDVIGVFVYLIGHNCFKKIWDTCQLAKKFRENNGNDNKNVNKIFSWNTVPVGSLFLSG